LFWLQASVVMRLLKDSSEKLMKRIFFFLTAIAAFTGIAAFTAPVSGHVDDEAAPIYGIKIPSGCRDWNLISIGHLAGGNVKQLRAQLGNDIAMDGFRECTLPFQDGTIFAAPHWNEAASDENTKGLARGFPGAGLQSSVAGQFVNVQFMVKDSKKYAATGGWGFADFKDGKPGNETLHKTCFPCHQPAKERDYVFAHYAL